MKKKVFYIFIFFIALTSYSQVKIENKNIVNQKIIYLTSSNSSNEEAIALFSREYKLKKENSFKALYSNQDKAGITHEKFQQYYKNLKVEFGTVITHSKNGVVSMVNGELYDVSGISLTPQITKSAGFQLALQSVNATTYLWEKEADAKLMTYKKPEGELLIFPNINNSNVHLVYKYDIYATNPISRQEVYVDANSGTILFSNSIIKHADKLESNDKSIKKAKELESVLLQGTADTKYSGTRNIETNSSELGGYVLNDITRGGGIYTYNSERTNTYPSTNFVDNDNNWTSAEHNNSNKDNAALDAHWGSEMTYDFWKNVFNRNSYDNNNAPIRSYVHYDNNPADGVGYGNAFWNGSVMTYGDGSLYPLTSIDVCGHEIGHAVCTYTANLVYQNESGAMNEGFSDIWGACIEHYGRTGSLQNPIPNSVWLIGEDISSSGLRSMSNPNSKGDPDTYLGTNWYSGTADSGGVHTNSGVLNHWFYIVTAGKSGTNNAPSPSTYSVTGIGMQKAAEIAYLAERDYLTPNATYQDARNATIAVASSLYCANSPETIAVTNAWYAVNVGAVYFAAADDIALESIGEVNTISCSSSSLTRNLILKNQGLNTINSATISYVLDGGSAVNLTYNGNIAPCEEATYPLTVNSLTRGAHILQVTTTIVNDGRPENNTKTITLLVNDAGTVGVVNPFTNSSEALISYKQNENGALWVRGTRTGAITTAGNTVYTTNSTANYPDNTKAYLVSQCYDLSNATNAQISFKMQYELENNWDVVYVEYSTNYGANWNVLGTKTANWYNSDRTNASSGASDDCQNCPGAQWTGVLAAYKTATTYTYPLSSLNAPSNVIFRIVFHSDPGVNNLGVTIDDFVISGVLANESFNQDLIGIYPNPSTGIYTLSLGNVAPISIAVYDISGKIILSKIDVLVKDSKTTIDLSDASKGIYFISINSNNGIISKRIVKE